MSQITLSNSHHYYAVIHLVRGLERTDSHLIIFLSNKIRVLMYKVISKIIFKVSLDSLVHNLGLELALSLN